MPEEFETDYVVPWRDLLNAWRREQRPKVTESALAQMLGMRWADVHRLCHDDEPMTQELAESLSSVTGIKADFWTGFYEGYMEGLANGKTVAT